MEYGWEYREPGIGCSRLDPDQPIGRCSNHQSDRTEGTSM
jgi:hypothetical protein